MQVKLLRVLQDKAYTPVGDTEARPADIRVIAATHRNLESMVETGTFREDLYYRLNVLPIVVPALRERGDDVLHLARKFLSRAAAAEARGTMSFDDDVGACLLRYAWPGNVRELEHAITRATVLSAGTTVTLADLPPRVRAAFGQAPVTPLPQARDIVPTGTPPNGLPELPEGGVNLKTTLERLERDMIERALAKTGGNKNRAAALLGLNRTTLVEKLKRM
jgi:transcriptional regulator with PAS, ATPase and Fis domain